MWRGCEVEKRQALTVTVDAVPENLALVRSRLRCWLESAGVGAETAADVLLAVGEATANAAEHARSGVAHTVQMTMQALLVGNCLDLEVSDNGRWKPVEPAAGYRGHGLKLIEALVDSSAVTTTQDGTTVNMRKELSR